MPTYNFYNSATGETKTEFLWIHELEGYLKENPEWVQSPPDTSTLADPWRMGRIKPAEGFREILRAVKKKYKDSTVEV